MTAQPTEQVLDDLRAGRMVILADGVNGEAQLCMAAEHVTPEPSTSWPRTPAAWCA